MKLDVFFHLWNVYLHMYRFIYISQCVDILDGYFCFFVHHIQSLDFGWAARWGTGLAQACQWHSIAQQLLVAMTPWPAFPLHRE